MVETTGTSQKRENIYFEVTVIINQASSFMEPTREEEARQTGLKKTPGGGHLPENYGGEYYIGAAWNVKPRLQ